MRLDWVLKAGAVLLALLLATLSISSLGLLSKTRDYLERESEKRLLNLAEVVSARVQENYAEAAKDPYFLYAIFIKESFAGLALLDRQGGVIVEPTNTYKKGERYRVLEMVPVRLAGVWGGKAEVTPLYKRHGRTVRSVFFPVRDGGGDTTAIGAITIDAGYIDDLTRQDTTFFLLKSLSATFLFIVILYTLRTTVSAERRFVKSAKAPGPDGPYDAGDNTSFMVGAFHSVVSELKEKERELKELKEQAESRARSIESYNENVLRNIQSGVMTFDREGRVITANSASEAILRQGKGSMAGKGLEDVFGEGSWVCGLVRNTLETGRPVSRAEGEVAVSAGVSCWLGAGTSPMAGGDGTEGAILIFTDITEVKVLRERMELKERMTVLGEMSAGIAHELRNPMGVVSGYADILARILKDDGKGLDAVKSIQAEVRLMDEIISEFMKFSQPTELNITKVDVKELLEEALRSVAGMGEGVLRDAGIADGLPRVEGDPVLLRQAFVNLIKNAMEAMPGGGRLTVTAGLVEADEKGGALELRLPGRRYVRVEVTDTGEGIAEKDLKKIFTPFFTTKAKGTGLGLALVQKILVYHGGRAAVRSAKGKGATFSVYLPAGAGERA